MKMASEQISLEAAFHGPRTLLLQVRVSKGLLESLKAEATERNAPLPELVREYLSFCLIPGALDRQIQKGLRIVESENILKDVQEYFVDLSELVEEAETVVERGVKMREVLGRITQEMESLIGKIRDVHKIINYPFFYLPEQDSSTVSE
jgi:hypothetical protein